MTYVQQSGTITPGHLATWDTSGIIGDGGAKAYYNQVLGSLSQADFNSTADQAIALPSTLNYFQLTSIIVAGASLSLDTAAGGFYPAASKAGSALVASSQAYSSLTGSTLLLACTLTSAAQTAYYSRSQLADWAIYFSLTTAQGATATASIFVTGIPLG